MDRLYRIFNELGIPCYIVFDYDKNNEDKNIIEKSKELLGLVEEDTGPPEHILITDKVACFPNKWETDLSHEVDNFEKLTAEARKVLGIQTDTGKPLIARYLAKKLISQDPLLIPNSIIKILEKAVAIKWEKC